MGAATFLSRITGLVREQIFAYFFGAGNFTDAFNIAFRIPNLLRDLFAEGALSSAFIPTFTRVRAERGERDAWRVAGLVFRLLFAIGVFVAIVGVILAPQLVGLFAPKFKEIPEKFAVTVFMTRILFPFFPLVALAAAYMGILNACGKFFLPAFASALFNITSIITGLLFSYVMPKFGYAPITGMAVGVVIGGAAQAFSQLPVLYKSGYHYEPRIETGPKAQASFTKEPALREIVFLMGPSILGLSATQLNVLINSNLATSLQPGAVSWLNYAFRLMQFPIGIFGVSLAAATLPKISRYMIEKNPEIRARTVRKELTESMNAVFAINLPASAGMAAIGIPIVALLFQYGRFTYDDTVNTAKVLSCYAIGLTAYSLVKVLVPVCYVTKQTRAAVVSSLISVAMTYFVGSALSKDYGTTGLAFTTAMSAILSATYLTWLLRAWIDFRRLLPALFRQLVIAVAMGAGVLYSLPIVTDLVETVFFGRFVSMERLTIVGVEMLIGGILVVVLGKLFRAPETTQMIDLFANRLGPKLRKIFSAKSAK